MPLYDYECLSCGHRFELKQPFNSEPTGTCPECKGRARRKFHVVPVIYKGSGFYTTDYGRPSFSPNSTDGNGTGEKEKKTPSKVKSAPEATEKE